MGLLERIVEKVYHGHHTRKHHSERVAGEMSLDGHVREVEYTHCNKRNNYSDPAHGVRAEPFNSIHGVRPNAGREFHPHPPAMPPVSVIEPVVVVGTLLPPPPLSPSPVTKVVVSDWRPAGEAVKHCDDHAYQAEPRGFGLR